MSDELELELDLTDPRAGHRPVAGTLAHELGESKAATIEKTAKDDYLDHLRSSIDRARQVLEDRLDTPRPRRERAEEELERALEEEREAFEGKWRSKFEWLRKRAEKAEKELPALTNGPASPAEDDIRRWVREAPDVEERQKRVREIVEDGPDEARRAIFRSDVPARAAGFATSEMRERALQEAMRAADPEAYETARAVRKAAGHLTTDLERFHESQAVVRNKALRIFDRFTSD